MIFNYQILTFSIKSLQEFNEEYEIMYDSIYDLLWDTEYEPRLEEDYEEALLHTEYYPEYRVDTTMAIRIDSYRQEAHQRVKWILAKWEDHLTAGKLPYGYSRILRYRRRRNAIAGRL